MFYLVFLTLSEIPSIDLPQRPRVGLEYVSLEKMREQAAFPRRSRIVLSRGGAREQRIRVGL